MVLEGSSLDVVKYGDGVEIDFIKLFLVEFSQGQGFEFGQVLLNPSDLGLLDLTEEPSE